MTIEAQFRYNYEAHPTVQWGDIKKVQVETLRVIVTADGDGFSADLPWISKYAPIPKISSEKVLANWHRAPLAWWQTQVNFAVWCATAGCGVGVDHLQHENALVAAVYRFHAYYQVRRILAELKAPQPTDVGFDPEDNQYDGRAFERLCKAFGVDQKNQQQFRIQGPNEGAGQNYFYVTRIGYQPAWPSGEAQKYVVGHHSFTKSTSRSTLHIDYIYQDQVSSEEWTKLIPGPGQTKGLTLEGVQRLNDSIRTYVWAILGAQGQTRSAIRGPDTTRLDAQKQFVGNVEDAINSPVDLPAAIQRYQDVLQYAGSQVNFVFGAGLYMAPSDMVLDIGRGVRGYNNKILTAGNDIPGLGPVDVNSGHEMSAPTGTTPTVDDDFAGNATATPAPAPARHPVSTEPTARSAASGDHEAEKLAIAVLGTAAFAAGFYYWRGRLI